MRLLILFISILQISNARSSESPVKVKVSLYPVGSFEITAHKLMGVGKKTGESFSAGELKVSVDSLKTGMSLRDRHLHEKLESKKYKYIVVTGVQASGGKGTAEINIRNVSRKISFNYKVDGPKKAMATFKLNLKDYQLTNINYKGVGVEDEVEVTVTVAYL